MGRPPLSSHGGQPQIGAGRGSVPRANLRGDMMTTSLKAMAAAAAAASSTMLGLASAPAALAGTVPAAAHPTGHGTVTYHFNGKCLDDNQGSGTDGTKVQIWTCNGNARSQEWTRYSDGTLRIHGKCLDVTGRSTRLGAKIEIWTCNGGSNQQWRIEQVSQNDFGPIVGVGSGNALADPGHSNTNGTQLKMGRYRGDQTLQPWHVSFHHYHH